MFVVDASVWVSYIVQDEHFHHASREWITAQIHVGALLYAPTLLLPELAGGVARRTGVLGPGARAVALVRGLFHVRLIPVDDSLGDVGAALASQLRLRGSDAVYTALAKRMGCPLISWDNEQRERSSLVVTAASPNGGT